MPKRFTSPSQSPFKSATADVFVSVRNESPINQLSEIKTVAVTGTLGATRVAMEELGDTVRYIKYQDYLFALQAYSKQEVEALVLPSVFWGPKNSLRDLWRVVHTFNKKARVVVLVSQWASDEQSKQLQSLFIASESGSLAFKTWSIDFGLKGFVKPDAVQSSLLQSNSVQ